MKCFLDTNVLVAASLTEHEHHNRALFILQKIHQQEAEGGVSAHTLLEIYAILTRLPRHPKLTPFEAESLIEGNVLKHMHVVELTAREYIQLLKRLRQGGVTGGQSYDALHFACALKFGADELYTFNVHHFANLPRMESALRIVSP